MYNVSNGFHAAIANGNEQKALLIFPDGFFTDEDIVVDRGIELNDNFNMEEDLSIGQATSNELHFSLVNEDRLLNNYEFGEFSAYIGVQTSTGTYSSSGTIYARNGSNTYVATSYYPYLTRNGSAMAQVPGSALTNIIIFNGMVYCFMRNGSVQVYNDSTGAAVLTTVPAHMTERYKQATMTGMCFDKSTRLLKIWRGGWLYTYEFCPLGCFIAKRPKAPDVIQIDMTCYDAMTKFDGDMSTVSVTYPITISSLFARICTEVGVEYILPNPFINGNAVISSKPKDFDNATIRDVLKWIAEAACANARINRDGKVILDWIRTGTGQVLGTGNYSEFTPYWYETKKVTKLYNRDIQGGTQTTYGSGTEGYLIQDNPLLRGV